MAKMKIVPRRIAELTLDPKNARKHGEESIRSKREILLKFGQQRPIVIDSEDIVRAGNGFTLAAQSLGWEWIDTVKTSLTGPELIAYAIADNRTGELSEWDDSVLSEILAEFAEVDVPLFESTGFSEKDLADLLESCKVEPEIVEDDVPEVPTEPRTKVGDLWLLGDHRLLCGDSTKPEDVARLMDGETVEICFTSPPYVDQRTYGGLADLSIDRIVQFIPAAESQVEFFAVNLGISRKDGSIVRYWDEYIKAAERCGLSLLSWNIWDREKAHSVGQHTAMFPIEHEWVFFFGRSPKKLIPTIENTTAGKVSGRQIRKADGTCSFGHDHVNRTHRELGTIWRGTRAATNKDHSATFPVAFAAAYISSFAGDVYDPFLGSGTTMIAAEQLGRRCFGIEISPTYCDLIISRWETFTGKKAVHFGNCVVSSQD